MKIGKYLRNLRKNKRLSLRQLEKEIGISYNTLGSYERNTCQPTIENCYNICKYFEVPIEYLVLGEDCIQNYQDIELIELFNKADRMEKEDREMIKKLLKKYIYTKEELNQIIKNIE